MSQPQGKTADGGLTMHTVTIHWGTQTRKVRAEDGMDLLRLLEKEQIIISAPCQGKGRCGKCRVTADGKEVLACQTPIHGDMTVLVPRSEGTGLSVFSAGPWPEGHQGLGIALDIGTTTLAAVLADLSTGQVLASRSMLNPQRVCGADVISRIAACGEGQLELLTDLVRTAARQLTEQLLPAAKGRPVDLMTVCGNTTMAHLFCGVDPSPIGVAPYTPVFTGMKEYPGRELGLPVETVFVLPSAAGYIGSDVVCGILALGEDPSVRLLADLGTNGELALIRGERIVCASTAAGPALEGANIECGTGGIPGAVCAVSDDLGFRTVSDQPAAGICGSGLTDLIAVLLRRGVIDETGALDEECGGELEARIDGQRFYLLEDLWLSQKDIRQFQLAKAAINAGIETLCENAGLRCADVGRLYVAGGLGYYLAEKSMLETGLIPSPFAGKLETPGNTALAGAVRCLLKQERDRVCALADSIEICELTGRSDFSDRFIDAMCFE